MTAHDRRRVRRMIDAPDGVDVSAGAGRPARSCSPARCCIATGARLRRRRGAGGCPGRPAAQISPEAARLGHLIGNLHRDIEADGDDVVALADAALADRLRRAGVPFTRSGARFTAARQESTRTDGCRPRAAPPAAAVRLAVSGRRVRAFGRPRDLRGARRLAAGAAPGPARADRAGLGTQRARGRVPRLARRRPTATQI